MIPSAELIRRLTKELQKMRYDLTEFGQGFHQGIKLCISIVVEFEGETKRHMQNNPRAIGAFLGQMHRAVKR